MGKASQKGYGEGGRGDSGRIGRKTFVQSRMQMRQLEKRVKGGVEVCVVL